MAVPILSTKLYIPPPRAQLIPRPRLTERLNQSLQANSKLTLIAAPPGFGKTTLLSEWLHRQDRPGPKGPAEKHVAWVSLDERDNDPVRFWSYVFTALDGGEPGSTAEAMSLLHAAQAPPIETTLTALVNALVDLPPQFVLILDDYHLIQADPIHRALTFLLDNLPPSMHLIITSRTDPPLPLTRLRVRGHLTELRENDLRFTLTEAVTFFNQMMGLNLAPADIVALEERTEGWIAGLQLAALSMQGRVDPTGFVRAFTGSHRYVIDYLAEEVLNRQPAHIQTFLLQTSILDRLHGPLCDAVLGNTGQKENGHPQIITPTARPPGTAASGQEILTYLDQANLFLVPLDNNRRWYRYHHLFADFLRTHLHQTLSQAEVVALHQRASHWYATRGDLAEAVNHALAAGNFEEAGQLIEEVIIPLLVRGEVITIMDWLAALPPQLLHTRPRLSLGQAWALVITTGWDRAEQFVDNAARELSANQATDQTSDDPAIRGMWGEIAAIRAMLAGNRGQPDQAIQLCRQALERLPQDNSIVRAIIMMNLGAAYELTDDLEKATQTLIQTITLARTTANLIIVITATNLLARIKEEQGLLPEAADLYGRALRFVEQQRGERKQPSPVAKGTYLDLAELLREQNELEEAKHYLTMSLELPPHVDAIGNSTAIGHLILARILQAQGDEAGAGQAIEQAEQALPDGSPITRWVGAIKARLALAWGDLAAAEQWALSCGLPQDESANYGHFPGEYATLARILIARDRFSEALDLLQAMQAAAESTGRNGHLLEISMLQALTLAAQGQPERALTPLVRALTLAEPGGYVRTFADEGLPLAQLLHLAKTRGLLPNPAYADRLLAALGQEFRETALSGSTPSPLIEPLSERELEVLSLVAAGLSNQQIAGKLFIAEGTVKKHLNNIFGKLNVRSRTQAARQATELGLL